MKKPCVRIPESAVSSMTPRMQPGGGAAQRDEAIGEFAQALALDPGHVDALYNQAVALASAGRRDEATAALGEALRREPNQPGLRRLLEQIERAPP
jgi:tetratricopeptide (TPR) repeat protein